MIKSCLVKEILLERSLHINEMKLSYISESNLHHISTKIDITDQNGKSKTLKEVIHLNLVLHINVRCRGNIFIDGKCYINEKWLEKKKNIKLLVYYIIHVHFVCVCAHVCMCTCKERKIRLVRKEGLEGQFLLCLLIIHGL